MSGNLLAPALWAAAAGAALTFASFGLLQTFGAVEREEATVEARDDNQPATEGNAHHLVLRTASGERFDVAGTDENLDLRPGLPVGLEISEAGRAVQAVDISGERVPVDTGGEITFWVVVFGSGMLFGALASAAETGRPVPAAVSTVAGLAAGALPVLLLF